MYTARRIVPLALLAIAMGALSLGGAASAHPDRSTVEGRASSRPSEPAAVAANKRLVLSFFDDVLNGHHGDRAAHYFSEDAVWSAGTLGPVTGGDNVAGLLTSVVTAIPDLHADIQDVLGQGNEVMVRVVVTGHLQGPLLGIDGTGQSLRWDAIDLFRLEDGKISREWAAEDFVAFLNSTGTYQAPWIP